MMMEAPNHRRGDERVTAAPTGGDPDGRRGAGAVRPPGPEEPRGTVATSERAGRDNQPPSFGDALRSPRVWITFLVVAVLNWFLVPLLFPGPEARVTIPYTAFTQQVAAGNVAEITSRGDTVQGQFKTPIPEPSPSCWTDATHVEPVRDAYSDLCGRKGSGGLARRPGGSDQRPATGGTPLGSDESPAGIRADVAPDRRLPLALQPNESGRANVWKEPRPSLRARRGQFALFDVVPGCWRLRSRLG